MGNPDGCRFLFAEIINLAIRDAVSYREVEKDDYEDFSSNYRQDILNYEAKKARSWLLSSNEFLHFYLHNLGVDPDAFKYRMKKLFSEKDSYKIRQQIKRSFVKFDKSKIKHNLELSEGF